MLGKLRTMAIAAATCQPQARSTKALGRHVGIHGDEDVTCSSRSFGQYTSLLQS
jgi:hypothetical protein